MTKFKLLNEETLKEGFDFLAKNYFLINNYVSYEVLKKTYYKILIINTIYIFIIINCFHEI